MIKIFTGVLDYLASSLLTIHPSDAFAHTHTKNAWLRIVSSTEGVDETVKTI